MDPRLALARLTTGSPDLASPTTTGMLPALTAHDVARALAGLDRLATAVLRAKWAQESASIHEVQQHVYEQARGRGWRPQILTPFSQLVVTDWLGLIRCPRCQGRGETVIKRQLRACPTCHGSGQPPRAGAFRARFLGVDRRRWHSTWQAHHGRFVDYLQQVESSALEQLHKRFR